MTSRGEESSVMLLTLPPELVSQIITHIQTARSLSRLSKTCKKLHSLVEQDGFRIFVQTRFPYFQPPVTVLHSPSFWKDAAHGLTTNSRNWDRKAFLAWSINPRHEESQDLRRQRTYFRSGQTMGFVPVIDSYETWYGGNWSSRKEVVAWGAGAGLVMRVKTMGHKTKNMWDAAANGSLKDFNVHKHSIFWAKYLEKGAVEGKDDITTVNLRPQSNLDDPERIVIGRASGTLSLISVKRYNVGDQAKAITSYETAGSSVRSTTISPGSDPLLVACLSDSIVALYPLDSAQSQVSSTGETSVIPFGQSGRTWCSQFLRENRLAVGFGPAKAPVHVYDIGRGELMTEPVRSLELSDVSADVRVNNPEVDSSSATSIYSLAPLHLSSSGGGMEGDTFLSGGYDGICRIHDLRGPHSTVGEFRDPVDMFSPIYSLLPIGTERFVAGGGRHSIIKIFDFRMPGNKLYHATDLDPCFSEKIVAPKQSEKAKQSRCCYHHYDAKHNRRGWNVFLRPQSHRARRDSPVYALSRPSQGSLSFFAGIENHIIQMDMVSMLDQHPDPVYANGPARQRNKGEPDPVYANIPARQGNNVGVRRRWDPHREAIPMSMYEHDDGAVSLKTQRVELDDRDRYANQPGWDERWFDPKC